MRFTVTTGLEWPLVASEPGVGHQDGSAWIDVSSYEDTAYFKLEVDASPTATATVHVHEEPAQGDESCEGQTN